MEDEDISDIIKFAQQYPEIEAVYLSQTPSGECRVYFYVPGYHFNREMQQAANVLDKELGLEMGMLAIWRSPEEAEKQGKLEKVIWKKEKNQ